ncbi:HAD family hydrolase [Polymorphum gilvum]|uniref:Haloacid dehalogenase-like hydrolase, putative n=1 Tax=Polymorphum gilvum (strain LMG 25793 / CGMCC 1.9160 / SL003B-26A1) TaxID=991905 RepID=F2J2S0_POLGS|nr:HAD family phosphatase [Polymorphum gilvum]ADZ72094.1 Haloacid dehalogenase-like hydrolase, putative [Polymorphum gilvum SL003B-26A1]
MDSRITTVVFDIGNVLIEWDPEHLYRKLIPDPEDRRRFLSEICTPAWNLEQDRGRSWAEAVAERIALFPDHAELIRAYDLRWHEMVPGAIAETVEILYELQNAGVPLHAITNFSSEKFAEAQERFAFLKTAFRSVVVSAHQGLLKPDRSIYEVLLKSAGLAPETCLFVDDSLRNVEGARTVGMQAVHFTTADRLRADMKALGLPLR